MSFNATKFQPVDSIAVWSKQVKITNSLVKTFEKDQKEYGTKLALTNFVWLLATGLLHDLGIGNVKTKK